MGLYADRVLPRLIDATLGSAECRSIRTRVLTGLSGRVLEIGFGSGLNVPLYPPVVTRVLAVDPSGGGRRLASARLAASPIPVEFVATDGQCLPLEDPAVDHAVSTWTLCTIPDAAAALAEIRRVLRPGGTLRFAEHGRCPDPKVALWQDRLTPLQRRVAGGCHLNRPIDRLVADSGLRLQRLETSFMRGPKVAAWLYEGVAVKDD